MEIRTSMERTLRTIPIGGRGITDIGTDIAVATGSTINRKNDVALAPTLATIRLSRRWGTQIIGWPKL
jgi:hypothetical protein